MHRTLKHRKLMNDFELAPDKNSQHENDSFTAQQPLHPTGYQSSSVRPVCFPHCSLWAGGAAGKHGSPATIRNRNDICTRFNKIAACSRKTTWTWKNRSKYVELFHLARSYTSPSHRRGWKRLKIRPLAGSSSGYHGIQSARGSHRAQPLPAECCL